MEEGLKKRIQAFILTKGLKQSDIIKATGIPQPTFQKQVTGGSAVSAKSLMIILDAYPELSAEWLLRGKGSMFVSENTGKTYNITRQGGNGEGQVNIVGDGNEVDKDGLLKLALEQNQQLINALLGNK